MLSPRLQRLIQFYEGLTPGELERLSDLYADRASFKDPFNRVTGVPAITAIFADMFVAMHEPKFKILTAVEQGEDAFLTWDFTFRIKKFRPHETLTIHGASHLRFDPDGRITLHRDYWDAAEELYAKLPVLGALIRILQRKFSHSL